jgi:hypothetical protein
MYRFDLGEIRYVGIEVVSTNGDSFEITNASARVLQNGKEVTTLSVAIYGGKMIALFSADSPGSYFVNFSYTIGAEKFVDPVRIEVTA